MLAWSAAVGLVPFIVSEALTRSLPPLAWLCVVGSGACCGGYYLFLTLGYESGEFTVVYPVARALPVLLVGVADVLRGRWPSAFGWLGMVLVAAGCVLVPLTRCARSRGAITSTAPRCGWC
jgi:drug/metabolite transporter (DMT)-like permease